MLKGTWFSGRSVAVQRLSEQIQRLAKFPYPLCIQGEAGVGKRRAARAIYEQSGLLAVPFYSVDITECEVSLPVVKLLRHEGGFVVLEEIGCAPRKFQDRCWIWLRHLGQDAKNVRIVSTFSGNLGNLVAKNCFRPDLFLRLRMTNLEVPPLRERKEDIPFLLRELLQDLAQQNQEQCKMFTAEAMRWILEFPWPGNVSQLRQMVTMAVASSGGNILDIDVLQADYDVNPDHATPESLLDPQTLAERLQTFELQVIHETLDKVGGLRDKAAAVLGIDRRTLQRKLRRWRMSQPNQNLK